MIFLDDIILDSKIILHVEIEKNCLPKYQSPSIYEDISKPIIIVDSELDAILMCYR